MDCLLYPKYRLGGTGARGASAELHPVVGASLPLAPGMTKGTEGLNGPLDTHGIWVTVLAACIPFLPCCSCLEPPAPGPASL